MSDTAVLERTEIKITEDSNWKIVFHNDNITPMEFVVALLTQVFMVDFDAAVVVMFNVHNNGNAVVKEYSSYDMAEQKLAEANQFIKEYGYNLKITIEK